MTSRKYQINMSPTRKADIKSEKDRTRAGIPRKSNDTVSYLSSCEFEKSNTTGSLSKIIFYKHHLWIILPMEYFVMLSLSLSLLFARWSIAFSLFMSCRNSNKTSESAVFIASEMHLIGALFSHSILDRTNNDQEASVL